MDAVMKLMSRGRTARVAPAPKSKTPTPSPKTPTPSPKGKTAKKRSSNGERKLPQAQIDRIIKYEKLEQFGPPRTAAHYVELEKDLKRFRYGKDKKLSEIRIYGLAEKFALPHTK